jgi:hypothetical protein
MDNGTNFTPLLQEIADENDRLKQAKTPEEKTEITTRMLGLIGIAQNQAHVERKKMSDFLTGMNVDIKEILEQARLTNGNVKYLKNWREHASKELLALTEHQKIIAHNLNQVGDELKQFQERHGPHTEEGQMVKALVLLRRHWKGWTASTAFILTILFFLIKYDIIIFNLKG